MVVKHPSEYEAHFFKGINVMVVDPNTTITDNRTGETVTITDECYVMKGSVMWCTQNTYNLLEGRIKKEEEIPSG